MILGQEKPPLDGATLAHYGVKGMKWGVRKDRAPKDRSTESRHLRKESSKALRTYMWDSIKNEPMWGGMTEEEYRSLSTQGEKFAKNSTLRRVTLDPEAKLEGATYVSKLQQDSMFYRAALPAVGPQNGGMGNGGAKRYKKPNYEIEMKATKQLSSPSEKERVDSFIELLERPCIPQKGKKAPITGREYLEKMGYKPLFKRYDTLELGLKSWTDFAQMQGDKENPLAQAYFNNLRSKGFNAVIDDNDAGRYTKKPIVLLDPGATVKVTKVRRLTTDEINQAQRSLVKKGGG